MRIAVTLFVCAALLGGHVSVSFTGESSTQPAADTGISAPPPSSLDTTMLEAAVARYPFLWQGTPEDPGNPRDRYPADVSALYQQLGERYLQEDPKTAKAYVLLGESKAFDRDYVGARALFEQGLVQAPSADLAYGVGWCTLREADPNYFPNRGVEAIEKAAAAFRRALEIDAKHALAVDSLAFSEYWLAVKTRTTGPNAPAEAKTAWWWHTEAAIDAFSRYLALRPGSGLRYRMLGELYHSRGDAERAAVCWEKAVELGSPYIHASRLVHVYIELKDRRRANAAFHFAEARDAKWVGTRDWQVTGIRLGHFLQESGHCDEAASTMCRVARRVPSALHFYEAGRALTAAGKPAEALVWLRRAKERNPPWPVTLSRAISDAEAKLRRRGAR